MRSFTSDDVWTPPPKYKFDQDRDAEFYYSLHLPDPDNEACHIYHRPTAILWAFTDSQDKAMRICNALNGVRGENQR